MKKNMNCIFCSIFLFFYFIFYFFHRFIYDSFFFSLYFLIHLFSLLSFVFSFFISLIRLVCNPWGLFLLSVLTTVIVYNLYTDLVAHRRSTSEEWKKWKEKNTHERKNERRKEIEEREKKERADTHTIYTRAAHKSGLRIVAASSAARATINSPLLLSAPLLGSHCVYVVSSLLFASDVSPNGESFGTYRCFQHRPVLSSDPDPSLFALFVFHDFVVGGPLPLKAASLISILASRGLEKSNAYYSVARFKKLIYQRSFYLLCWF